MHNCFVVLVMSVIVAGAVRRNAVASNNLVLLWYSLMVSA